MTDTTMKTIPYQQRRPRRFHSTGIAWWIGLIAFAISLPCLAQGAQGVDLRYDSLLKRQERNKTTPGNEFGDQHGIESGSLTFNVVDV
ncbi:hypothetical protein, partial [Luteimonas saliphila]|uniref:hypothetical protein n=1 Tax=Luteimonas saliphila TaxID=2804919 RepID=UPI00192D5518